MKLAGIATLLALTLAGCSPEQPEQPNESNAVNLTGDVAEVEDAEDPYMRTPEQKRAAYRRYEAQMQKACAEHPDLVIEMSGQGMSEARRKESIAGCLAEAEQGKKELIEEGLIAK